MNTRNRVTGDCAPNERKSQVSLGRLGYLLSRSASIQGRWVKVGVSRHATIHDYFCSALAIDLMVDAEVGEVAQRMAAAGAVDRAGFAGNDDDVHYGRLASVGQGPRSKSQTTDAGEFEQ